MVELKRLSTEAIPAALEKALRYRLLNEPAEAESICHDVLHVDPENQQALVLLLLALTDRFDKGYAVVTREWKAGDRIELELPMEPQRVVADSRIKADAGRTALKYGPLIYNVETPDNRNLDQKIGAAPLRTQWRPDLLGGMVVITGKWADGSDLVAVPNYARMNRVGPPHEYPREEETTNSPDASSPSLASKVWI